MLREKKNNTVLREVRTNIRHLPSLGQGIWAFGVSVTYHNWRHIKCSIILYKAMRGYNAEAFFLLQTKIRGSFSSFSETKNCIFVRQAYSIVLALLRLINFPFQ